MSRSFALAAMLLGLLIAAQAATAADTFTSPLLAAAADGSTIALRPLDDPQNPYAAQYDGYDRLLYRCYASPPAGVAAKNSMLATGCVSAEGWLLPGNYTYFAGQSSDTEPLSVERFALRYDGRQAAEKLPPDRYCFTAQLDYGPAVQEALQEAWARANAGLFPPVPGWLGNHAPYKTVFVPNGEILCYGPLDLQVSFRDDTMEKNLQCPLGELWYRYSSDGRLLGQHDSGVLAYNQGWQKIYCRDYERLKLEDDLSRTGVPRYLTIESSGMIFTVQLPAVSSQAEVLQPFYIGGPGVQLLDCYDYDGSRLEHDAILSPQRQRLGRELSREDIQRLYAAQLEQGIVGPPSPFWGQPGGPVFVDPAPREPRRFGIQTIRKRGEPQTEKHVEVRPLDDPASPWHGQYEAWDYWAFENYGRDNPLMQDFYGRQSDALDAAAAKALAEGRDFNILAQQAKGCQPGPEDPWVDATVYVDPQGFQIPQRAAWLALYAAQTARPGSVLPQTQRFSYHAGAAMDSSLRAQYEAAKAAVAAQSTPLIPDWLGAAPPMRAAFMYDGNIAVLGRLGDGADPSLEQDYRAEWAAAEQVWRLYSPAGALLAESAASGMTHWSDLYAAELEKLEAQAKAAGHSTTGWLAGFLIVEDSGGKVLTAYDYAARPLDTGQLLAIPARAGSLLKGSEIAELYALQQRQ